MPEDSFSRDPNIVQRPTASVLKALRNRVLGGCLFVHKWNIQTETRQDVHGFSVISVIPYRTCERCGQMERGIFDTFWRDIVWEPLRKGTGMSPGRNRFFRQPSSPLDQLAHSWGLRRSRSGDKKISENAPRASSSLISIGWRGVSIRCLFSHRWIRKEYGVSSVVSYRACARCGTLQRALETLNGDTSWETIRGRTDVEQQQIWFVRQRSSRFDQLAHSLGLRRSRMSDGRT